MRAATVNTFRVPVNTLYYRPMDEQLLRPQVPELDAILGVKIPVLDDGFVRVVDYMGDDAAIVQAARVSYGAGTKTRSDNASQIRYLLLSTAAPAVRDVPDKAPSPHADGLLESVD